MKYLYRPGATLMTSSSYVGRKGFGWSAFVEVIMVICFLDLSSSQEYSQNPAAVEQALMDALPKEADLPAGYKWNSNDIQSSSSAINLSIDATVRTRWETDHADWVSQNHEAGSQWFSILVDCRANDMYKSPSEFRSWVLSTDHPIVTKGGIILPYEALPGAVIIDKVDNKEGGGALYQSTYQILFWKSPYYYGSVTIVVTTSCLYLCHQEHEKVLSLARTECEWLAHLVWSRLPAWGVCPQPPIILAGSLQGKQTEVDLKPRDPGIQSRGLCRDACGSDCPQTCLQKPDLVINVPDETGNNYYSCTYPGVVQCGSHRACVKHDACFDRCVSEEHETDESGWCHMKCNVDIFNEYGMSAKDWINGRGAFDHNLTFSYPAVQTGPFPGKPPTSLTPIANPPRIDQA